MSAEINLQQDFEKKMNNEKLNAGENFALWSNEFGAVEMIWGRKK